MDEDAFGRDQAALLASRIGSFRVGRRELGALAAALGLGLGARSAAAAGRQIVLACWGGAAVRAYDATVGKPFAQASGIGVSVDGAGPSLGKIRAMVRSGKVEWDLCDSSIGASQILGGDGLLQPIDYAIVDKTATLPGYAMKWCFGTSAYSYVLAYDSRATGGTAPQSWADFWDLRKYPGKRTLPRAMQGVLEAALLADGVARDKLYPLDVGRAMAKLRQIKDATTFWETGADSERMLRQGEVVMGSILSTRARWLDQTTDKRITWTWQDGLLTAGVFNVPKGNPAGAEAMRLLAAMTKPEVQVQLLKLLGSGPANPAASALVPAELRRIDPTYADNAARQVVLQQSWYSENYQAVAPKFRALVAS